MKMVKCCIKHCLRSAQTDMGVSFFRFPAENFRCDEWMIALGRTDLLGINAEKLHQMKYRICGMHFHGSSFSSMLLNRLKKDAIPINFPFQAYPGPYFEGDPNELEKLMPSKSENVPEVEGELKPNPKDAQVSDEENKTVSENDSSKKLEKQTDMETDEGIETEETIKKTDGISTNEDHKENEANTQKESDASQEAENADNTNIEDSESQEQVDNASKENNKSQSKENKGTESKMNEETESKTNEETEGKDNEKTESEGDNKSESNECEKTDKDESENAQTTVIQNGDADENSRVEDSRMETDENEDDDEYFNPLLLCPDISMDVEESPVLTGSADCSQNDLSDANALFAPLFSTFVDEMTGAEISFNLTAEEQQLRERLYGPNNPIEYTKIHCTACNVHLGSALAGQTNRFVHPLLKVLICKECYHFYTSGEFEKDEDGSELYCRWCGQGGQVLCCTMCEFVFCKKCIRINFGRKKLTQVRDSDEWKCFRCDMSQLKALRAMCVEFFEYIRKETARASTYTDSDAVNKDLTNCCQPQNRKRAAPSETGTENEVVKKTKRRKTAEDDPDYNPFAKADDDERSNSPIPSTSGVKTVPAAAKQPVPILPKPAGITPEVSFPGKSPSSTVRIGNTIINVKSLGTTSPRPPTANAPPSVSRNTAIRSSMPTMRPKPAMYMPRTPQTTVRPTNSTIPAVGSLAHIRATASKSQSQPQVSMKHEWFEKTVRAAARVNSNLSYTLTQLNKAQSSASSVEQLAVVHNKLQEILSSSINSLIQIRKNLRTEFIAGIKTIRFPPKQQKVDPNDDDVIIINSDPPTTPNKGIITTPGQKSVPKQIKSTPVRVNSNNSSSGSSTPSTGYLKVRSFSQLQNVTSECITIPDDDPPSESNKEEPIVVEINEEEVNEEFSNSEKDKESTSKPEEENVGSSKNDEEKTEDQGHSKDKEESAIKESPKKAKSKDDLKDETHQEDTDKEKNKEEESKEKEKVEEPKEKDKDDESKKKDKKNSDCVTETNGTGSKDSKKCNGNIEEEEVRVKKEPEEHSYNVKDQPTAKIRRMLSVKVNLKKTPVVEDLVKKEPVENGEN